MMFCGIHSCQKGYRANKIGIHINLLHALLSYPQDINFYLQIPKYQFLRNSINFNFIILFFAVVMLKDKEENGMLSHIHSHDSYRSRELGVLEHNLLDGDMFLQVRTPPFKLFNVSRIFFQGNLVLKNEEASGMKLMIEWEKKDNTVKNKTHQ